ncbi:2'-5' RNA ligase family protein [Bradyrhizobium sp. sBnM-33]|uniref:2'-5' RNA ligase family protein n=2 Tax=Bradyrhizobium sp. sBnM-33 TaxID=2831780 RepID=UPI00397E233F
MAACCEAAGTCRTSCIRALSQFRVHDLCCASMDEFASFSSGRLFLAALPDAGTAERIHRLAGVLKRAHCLNGKLIAPDRLHVSLFSLGGLPDRQLCAAREAATELRTEPFEVSFDRTASFRGRPGNRPFVLIGEKGLCRLQSFRQMLGVAMARRGLRRLANTNFT